MLTAHSNCSGSRKFKVLLSRWTFGYTHETETDKRCQKFLTCLTDIVTLIVTLSLILFSGARTLPFRCSLASLYQ